MLKEPSSHAGEPAWSVAPCFKRVQQMHEDVIDKNNQPEDDYDAVGVIDNDRNIVCTCPKLVLASGFDDVSLLY
jgi:hypothetical protein